jgi:hypothetical protein
LVFLSGTRVELKLCGEMQGARADCNFLIYFTILSTD